MKLNFKGLSYFLIFSAITMHGSCQKSSTGQTTTGIIKATDAAYIGGSRIAWDYSTLSKVSVAAGYNGYARMIQLNDKSLLCTYESNGTIVTVKSFDAGKSWSAPVVVESGGNGINMAVPDILLLQDGSVLVCYNPRPYNISPDRKFGIRTKKSYDGGLTWMDARLLYEADYLFANGCWEPSAIQIPSGEIQLYFANEGVYPNSDEQNISLIRSADNGLTWTKTPQVVSFRAGHRDGMPVPVLLNNGRDIVFSIEDNGYSNFKPYLIRNTIAANWETVVDASSVNRDYALADRISDSIYAGAPYLRQLPDGETILSYQGTEDRTNDISNSEMKVVIGNENAKLFNHKSVPFAIAGSKSGLWNSLSVIDNNTVVALTSTNAYSGDGTTEIWMIKGHVIPELTAANEKINIDGIFDEASWITQFPVFVGHTGLTQARAQITYDNNFIYVLTVVTDNHVSISSNIESSDGVTVYIHDKNKTYNILYKGIFSIFVSADNKVVVKEGDNGNWNQREFTTLKSSTIKTANGYKQEIAIPWISIGGIPALNTAIGFNFGLTENSGNTAADYSETITSCPNNQPNTWMTLKLK